MVADHFGKLFTATPFCMHEVLFEGIQQAITRDMNDSLCDTSTERELREGVLRTLRAIGLSDDFQDLIYHSLCNIWYRVNINSFLSDKFHSTRGVRQGDPISPLLFIIAHQVLSANFKRLESQGAVKPYRMHGPKCENYLSPLLC